MIEIVDTITRVLECDFGLPVTRRRLVLPAAVARAARVADGLLQAAGQYDQRVHVLSEMDQSIACSIGRARRELGYRPRVGLEDGMRSSLASLPSRGVEL